MSTHVTFLLLGLANGAVFAALGLALVVTHRSAKVLNLAVSTIALFTATIYGGLRTGDLLIPLPLLPKQVHFADSLGFVPAAVLAMLITAGFGFVLYVLVFRPLRSAPTVATAVASLGISVVIVTVLTEKFGGSPTTTPPIFPAGDFNFGDVSVGKDRVWFAVSILGIALLMWALWRFTRFGLISRAVSQSEKGAYVVGIPVERVAAANWMISAMVAGMAGILMSPIVAAIPINYALFIVPGLAVATLGGFEYLAPAVLGGLALGALQSEATYLQTEWSWLPRTGTQELIPLLLILVILVARAKPLPSRGLLQARRLGRAPRPHHVLPTALVAGAGAVLLMTVLQDRYRAALMVSLVFVLISLSQVVVTGFSGQISLAQLTLAGVAGFSVGKLSTTYGVPFPVAPLLAALIAMVVGVVFALPAVRIRGLPVAVVTLALAVSLEAVWFRNTDFVTSSGQDVAPPKLFGLDVSVGFGASYPRLAFGLLLVVVVVLSAVGVAKLRTSRLGADMLAVRANEKAAAAAGVNVVRTKIVAFAIGAFLAGLGGAMLAYKQNNVSVDAFTAFAGLSVFATAFLGGITSVSGGVMAGMLATSGIFTQATSFIPYGGWYAALAGVGLVYTAIANPEGMVGPAHVALNARRLKGEPLRESAKPVLPAAERERMPRLRSTEVALSLRHLDVRYGGVKAVSDVTFDVHAGSITGLIGPNGAGKTSLLDAISGFVVASGEIDLNGRPIQKLPAYARAAGGLGRTFQSIELYDDLTVAENVAVGQAAARGKLDAGALTETLEIMGLTYVAERPAGELSQGTRQLVSIGRAVAGNPSVLVLDEPAAGLDPTEGQWLGERLRELCDTGISILIIDHDLQLMLDLCDELHVLDFGELIASGSPDDVRNDPKVKSAYIGGATHEAPREPSSSAGKGRSA